MQKRVKKYIDHLFSEVSETKQLYELKEEMNSNLMEKINDYIAAGDRSDDAFRKAVSSLGDMSELVTSLKKVSEEKMFEEMFKSQPISKKHAIGYSVTSAILLIGVMLSGIIYLQMNDWFTAIATLMPFFIIAVGSYVYFGLTQESANEYGMKGKRALIYSLASIVLVAGIFVSLLLYLKNQELFVVLASLIPFVIPAAIIFIYLGLTEKSRLKMGPQWQQHWVSYYKNPKSMVIRGNISGALWIFSIAAILLVGFTWSWLYAIIIFVIAVGAEVLIEALFAAKS